MNAKQIHHLTTAANTQMPPSDANPKATAEHWLSHLNSIEWKFCFIAAISWVCWETESKWKVLLDGKMNYALPLLYWENQQTYDDNEFCKIIELIKNEDSYNIRPNTTDIAIRRYVSALPMSDSKFVNLLSNKLHWTYYR